MSDNHQVPNNLDNRFKIGLILNTGFSILEFILGLISGSLALIADSGHNLTDSLSLVISIFANKISKRGASADKTYGYGRASILAALLNAFILIIVALYIFYEAYKRFSNPPHVEGSLVIIAAFFGFVINAGIAWSFLKGIKDLNVKSTIINFATDAIAQLGTIIAGVIIVLTKQTIVDPIISTIIGILLIYSAWRVIKDALHVLLEGVPDGVDTKKVKETILSSEKIKNVDDLHIWAISSHFAALSCHVVIEDCDLKESTKIIKRIKEELKEKFNIEHATIETELAKCPSEEK